MNKIQNMYVVIPVLLLCLGIFIFRSVFFNVTTHLLDWNDYPYYIWTIIEQAQNLRSFQFFALGEANIFYPHQSVLFFSDLLLPQAVIAAVLLTFTTNFILILNTLFFITLGLNSMASVFLWKRFSNNSAFVFFLSVATVFSPFLFLQLGHFQMINIWPLLFGVGLILKQHQKTSLFDSVILGLLLTLQFLISVYLAVFFIWIILVWYGVEVVFKLSQKQNILTSLLYPAITACSFLVTVVPFLWKYFDTQHAYQIHRSYGEYAFYAAHITDYFFHQIRPFRSFLAGTVFSGWNKFNQHTIGEWVSWPGISLVLLSTAGLFSFKFGKKVQEISIRLNQIDVFFFILLVTGFIFSLGPRLNVNGIFTNIPLPYHLVMKVLPLVEPVRATNRWAFLFYLGLAYFSGKALQKIEDNRVRNVVIAMMTVVFFLEIIPLQIPASSRSYYLQSRYLEIEQACAAEQKVLLEYPMNWQIESTGNEFYLPYKSEMLLASLQHGCYLVNGYSGFTPREIEEYEISITQAVQKNSPASFEKLLDKKNVSLLKLNVVAQDASDSARLRAFFSELHSFTAVSSDEGSIVYQKDL